MNEACSTEWSWLPWVFVPMIIVATVFLCLAAYSTFRFISVIIDDFMDL